MVERKGECFICIGDRVFVLRGKGEFHVCWNEGETLG